MPEYLSPGVYVEEIDAGPKPIEGVSTSTAGAVGVCEYGPTEGKPELITSFGDFQRKFGGFLKEPENRSLYNKWALNADEGGTWWQFPLAVKGFFDNGGKRLYVKRVFAASATKAKADFGFGVISEIEQDADAGDSSVRVRHILGISVGKQVKLFTGTPPVAAGTFTVVGYDAATRVVNVNRKLGVAIRADAAFLEVEERKAPTTPAQKTLSIRAKAHGNWGNNLQALLRPMVGATLNLFADPAANDNAVKTTATRTDALWVVTVDDVSGLADGDEIVIDDTIETKVAAKNDV